MVDSRSCSLYCSRLIVTVLFLLSTRRGLWCRCQSAQLDGFGGQFGDARGPGRRTQREEVGRRGHFNVRPPEQCSESNQARRALRAPSTAAPTKAPVLQHQLRESTTQSVERGRDANQFAQVRERAGTRLQVERLIDVGLPLFVLTWLCAF